METAEHPVQQVRLGVALVAVGVGVAATAVVAAGWPTLVAAGCLIVLVAALAVRAPAAALVVALGLAGFEGTLKVLLTGEQIPGPASPAAVGAGVIDAAFALAFVGLTVRHRRRLVDLVRGLDRWEQVVLGSLAAWIGLSLIQIPLSSDVSQAASGFRLTQMYVGAGLAALLAAGSLRGREWLARALLALAWLVCGYAAVRVAVGPSAAERAYAIAKDTVTFYGDSFRAVGSFSGAVPMVSFVTPIGVFATALGLLRRDLRLPALGAGALALVAVIGSYSRSALVAFGLGLACLGAIWFAQTRPSHRQRLIAAGLVAVVLVGTVGAALVASRGSPQLRERLNVFVDPAGDESLRDRWRTARDAVSDVDRRPLGQGLGEVGDASASAAAQRATTDNSFLKVLVEQGLPGGLLFVVGTLGTAAVVVRRLVAARPGSAVGIAALCGFAAFLALSMTGEYVEQPGKMVAWALLGLAVACTRSPAEGPVDDVMAPLSPGWPPATTRAVAGFAVGAGLCATAFALDRSAEFEARTALEPVRAGPFPAVRAPAHYRQLLTDPGLRRAAADASGFTDRPAPYRSVTVLRVRRRELTLGARGGTPVEARRYVDALAAELRRASRRVVRQGARRELRTPRLTSLDRLGAAGERARRVRRLAKAPRTRLAVSAPASADAIDGPADRIVDRLPGALPPRPSPIWSGLAVAGGLAALALAIGLLRARPR